MPLKIDPLEQHGLIRSHAINEGLQNRWGELDGQKVVIVLDKEHMQHAAMLGITVLDETRLSDVLPSIFRFLRSEGYQEKSIWVCKLSVSEPGRDNSMNCVYLWECVERPGERPYTCDIGMGNLTPGAVHELRQFIEANPLNPTFRRI